MGPVSWDTIFHSVLSVSTFCSKMVRVLVSHGASIGLRGGSDSWTPLMYAAMAGALYGWHLDPDLHSNVFVHIGLRSCDLH